MPGLIVGSRGSFVGRDYIGSPEWLGSGFISFIGSSLKSKSSIFISSGLLQFIGSSTKAVNTIRYPSGSILFNSSALFARNSQQYSQGQIVFNGQAIHSVSKLGASIWNSLSSQAVASVIGSTDVWGA